MLCPKPFPFYSHYESPFPRQASQQRPQKNPAEDELVQQMQVGKMECAW